jgi:imidazolonepropionase-like amidohydrolase
MKTRAPSLLFLSFVIVINFYSYVSTAQTSSATPHREVTSHAEVYAIKNVNIIPMTTGDTIINHATIVIKDKKISSINAPIPAGATIIDGKDKWLIPGLIDMHVHNLADISFNPDYPTKGPTAFTNTQDFMLLYVANGVTTVFELSGRVEHFGQRNDIVKGNVIGPRIALALLIDGGSASGIVANSPSDGRQTVRIAKAEGFDFIKVYSKLNKQTFDAIVDEAGKQLMKVVGHIPDVFKGKLEEAFVPGYAMIAHGEELSKQAVDFSVEEARHFAQLAKQNGTWLTPTLITIVRIGQQARTLDSIRNLSYFKYVSPLLQSKWLTANNYHVDSSASRLAYFDKLASFNNKLVKAFKEAGVPVVAGTDAGVSGVVWGFALHDELELLVKAGMTMREALASATRLPATWLGLLDKVGTIEVNKYADLLLLDANPLDNISNTRKISGVFVNGRWINRKQIDGMLLNVATKNKAADKDKYDWKKRRENNEQ